MRNRIVFFLFLLFPLVGNAQTKIILGVDGGLDLNFNSYYSNQPNYSYKQRLDFNSGLVFGLIMHDKNQLLLEFKYAKIGFTQYNNAVQGGDPTLTVDNSIFRINNFGINLRFDYRVLKKNKLEFYLAPSVKWENTMGDHERDHYMDGRYDTNLGLVPGAATNGYTYQTSLYGVGLGLMCKYNLNEFMGITVTPDYTFFFPSFYGNSTPYLQRYGLNFGLQFKL